MRVLLVEDEIRVASFIERGLKEEHYVVDSVLSAKDAIFNVSMYVYDFIILDRILPDSEGTQICKKIREMKINTPILMLTAKSSVSERVEGLDSGADDYLTKPFAFDELLARMRALLRRNLNTNSNELVVADLVLNQKNHKVFRADSEILLTSKEYALLEYFMLNAGEIVTRTMISEHVWNEDFDSLTNVIDVYVNYLRNKIDKGFDKQLLQTVRGTGYILKE